MSTTSYIELFYGVTVEDEQAKQWGFETPHKELELFNDSPEMDGNWCLGKVLKSITARNNDLSDCDNYIGIHDDGVIIPHELPNLIACHSTEVPRLHMYINLAY